MCDILFKEIVDVIKFVFSTRLANNLFDASGHLGDMLRLSFSERFLSLGKDDLSFVGLTKECLLVQRRQHKSREKVAILTMRSTVLGIEAIAYREHGKYFLILRQLLVDSFPVHFKVITPIDMQLAGKRILQGMHFRVGPGGTAPPNLLEVAVVVLLDVLEVV